MNATPTAMPIVAAYMALRLPAGTRVTYQGTVPSLRGEWTVQPCSCPLCFLAVLLGQPATRYELRGADDMPAVLHVRHTSVRPVTSDTELNEAGIWLLTKYAAVHLRQQLRRAFPGVKFSVRTGQGKRRYEIAVSWSGGPRRTAVATIAAPLLASYDSDGRCRPRAISVTVGGHTRTGTPIVSAVRLTRD